MSTILYPLELVVAWIMVAFHSVLSVIGLPKDSGWTWTLSIIGLVVVIRILLIPLFVKQIKASRGLQLIQPEMKKIQAKYKGKTDQESRQKMTQETMALYKETGTNPFASCLPILLQAPIFFALFRVLNGLKGIANGSKDAIGPMTRELASSAEASRLFGSQLSDTFLGTTQTSTKILTVVLIILMSASTFTTQRQLMMKNMPAAALDNPFAQQQKLLLYVLPLVFAVSGVNFPIGVLLYWLTTNVWSMGQQFYVIRRMPAPGSLAEKALHERRRRRGKAIPGEEPSADAGPESETAAPRQRVQPKRQTKAQRSSASGGASPAATSTPAATPAPAAAPTPPKPAPAPGANGAGSRSPNGRPQGGGGSKGKSKPKPKAQGKPAREG